MRLQCLLPVVLAFLAATAGCTTLTVKKAADSTKGIRYSLPKTLLVARPQADGSIIIDVEQVPDESRTYAIDAKSLATDHTLEVQVSKGLLTKVQWNPKSVGVLEQAVESAGVVAAKAAELRQTENDAKETEKKEAKKAAEGKIATAEAALLTVKTERAVALARLQALQDAIADPANNNADVQKQLNEDLRKAKVLAAEAAAKVAEQDAVLAALKQKLASDLGIGSVDATHTDPVDLVAGAQKYEDAKAAARIARQSLRKLQTDGAGTNEISAATTVVSEAERRETAAKGDLEALRTKTPDKGIQPIFGPVTYQILFPDRKNVQLQAVSFKGEPQPTYLVRVPAAPVVRKLTMEWSLPHATTKKRTLVVSHPDPITLTKESLNAYYDSGAKRKFGGTAITALRDALTVTDNVIFIPEDSLTFVRVIEVTGGNEALKGEVIPPPATK